MVTWDWICNYRNITSFLFLFFLHWHSWKTTLELMWAMVFFTEKKHWICVNRSVNNIGNDYLFNSDSSKVEQKLWINLSSSDAERHKAILQILEKGRNKAYKADETPLERRWTAFQQQRRVYFVCSTYFTLHVPQTHSPVALFTQWYKNSDRSSWLIRS